MADSGAIENARIAAQLKRGRVVREAGRLVGRARAEADPTAVFAVEFLMLAEAVDELDAAVREIHALECAAAAGSLE